VVGGRATHFCSWCQRLASADRQAAAAILATMTPRSGPGVVRRGGRWTELSTGDGQDEPVGLAALRERAERTRRAAATRRASARAAAGG
jgi:hypothetical protein